MRRKILGAVIETLLNLIIIALAFWGLGNVGTRLFEINFNWGFSQGLYCALVFLIIGSVYKNNGCLIRFTLK